MLRELRLEVYRGCPLVCRHCYQSQSSGDDSTPGKLVETEPTFSKLLDDFVSQGGSAVSLSGGEILLDSRWPRVRRLLLDLRGRGVREVRINSSLGFASREMLGELATLNIPILRVQAGIDGEHAHDFLRFPGAMDATLAAFRMLGSLGVDRLSARVTLFWGQFVGGVRLRNLEDLPAIVAACASHGVARVKTKVVHPTGMADDRAPLNSPDLAAVLMSLVQHRLDHPTSPRLLLTNPLPASVIAFALHAQARDSRGVEVERCQCGDANLAIDSDGFAYRCLFNFRKPELRLGNVLSEGLASIVSRKSRLEYARTGGVGRCGAYDDNIAQKPITIARGAS